MKHLYCTRCWRTEDFCLCGVVGAQGDGYKFSHGAALLIRSGVDWRDENQHDFYASVDAFDAAVRRMSGAEQQNQADGECAELRRIWRLPPVDEPHKQA